MAKYLAGYLHSSALTTLWLVYTFTRNSDILPGAIVVSVATAIIWLVAIGSNWEK